MELFGECLAGMLYSDEEIMENMSPEDAAEFIELRNELLLSRHETVLGRDYGNDEGELPMAAEEECAY